MIISLGSLNNVCFFLGGRDLEMVTIRDLLATEAPERFFDKGLGWGAKASAYREEIDRILSTNATPVLVELIDDVRTRLLPITAQQASELLDRTRIGTLIHGNEYQQIRQANPVGVPHLGGDVLAR